MRLDLEGLAASAVVGNGGSTPEPGESDWDARRGPLGATATDGLTGQQIEQLYALESFDLSPVRRRLIADGVIPASDVDEAILELRRYLGLIGITDRPVPMLSATIDDAWHTSLLFTRLYEELCFSCLGRFVHHDPRDEEAAISDGLETSVEDFEAAYRALFGPPSRLWNLHGRGRREH